MGDDDGSAVALTAPGLGARAAHPLLAPFSLTKSLTR